MKELPVPDIVLQQPPGTLRAIPEESALTLYLREDVWGMRKYPYRDCPVELRLATWDFDAVLLVVLAVRIARSDALTFDCLINVGQPEGVRAVQNLAQQSQIELHLVTTRVARSFRVVNPFRLEANRIVEAIRLRPAWSEEDFQRAGTRLNQLYPTAHALWWGVQQLPE